MRAGDRYVFGSGDERVYVFVKRVMGKHAVDLVCRTARGGSWVRREKRPLPSTFQRHDWTIEDLERECAR